MILKNDFVVPQPTRREMKLAMLSKRISRIFLRDGREKKLRKPTTKLGSEELKESFSRFGRISTIASFFNKQPENGRKNLF